MVGDAARFGLRGLFGRERLWRAGERESAAKAKMVFLNAELLVRAGPARRVRQVTEMHALTLVSDAIEACRNSPFALAKAERGRAL